MDIVARFANTEHMSSQGTIFHFQFWVYVFFFQDYVGETTIRSKIPVSYIGFLNGNLVMFAHDWYITENYGQIYQI